MTALRIAVIAAATLAVSLAVVAITGAVTDHLPATAFRLGSVPLYATWLAVGGLYCLACPGFAATPWRVQPATWTARDRWLAAAAAVLGLAMYAPLVVTIVRDGATPPRLDFIGGAVAAPIVEEWLFRGLLWNRLARAVRGERAGVIVNLTVGSAVFGLFHLSFEGISTRALLNVLPHAEFGALVGVLRWRTRSLLPGTCVHLVGNFLARLAMP